MSKPLEYIARIREARELTAGVQVQRCQARLQMCFRQQKHQEEQLEAYRYWRERREAVLFEILCAEPANARALECFQAELVVLRDREAMLAAKRKVADQALENAGQALAEARLTLFKAAKGKEKLFIYSAICQDDGNSNGV